MAGLGLIVDPSIGLFHSVARNAGRPAEPCLDQRVVAIPAMNALRCIEIVFTLELDAGDLFGDVDQLIDRYQFVAADVERFVDVMCRSICVPTRQSSMYMKLRVCSPSPQISISCLPKARHGDLP